MKPLRLETAEVVAHVIVFPVLRSVALVFSWSFHKTRGIAWEAYMARNVGSAQKPVKPRKSSV